MAAPLLTLTDIHLTFGGTPLLDGAGLQVEERARICLVGRNGSGKSTLLKIAAGTIEPDRGERIVQSGVDLRYLPQEPDLSGYASVTAYVEDGLGDVHDPSLAFRLLGELGLTGEEAPHALSGGEARKAALVRTLAANPDIILLDEPTNHLDMPTIEWLESALDRLRAALVMISHDRRFLERLSRSTVWLDRGRTRLLEQGFAAFEAWRDEQLELEDLERHKLERRIAAETDWLYYGGVTARRRRNEGRKRNLLAMRESLRNERRAQGNVKFSMNDTGARSGKLVFEAEGICKAYGDRVIVDGLSLRIDRGERIGLIGPNGAGKTTLINILTGKLEPDRGSVRLGANLQLATLDQTREALDDEMSVRDVLTGGGSDKVQVGGRSRHVQSYMKDFLFQPEQAGTPVKALSGGERARLLLARALALPSNVLVLDEPTNDLDLETLDLLQEMIADYAGTVLLASHDRDFLDRIVTSVVMYEGDGRWTSYAGGYSDMLAQRGKGVEARRMDGRRPTGPVNKTADTPPAGASAVPRRKLSFKEKHALEKLPARLEDLAARKTSLQDQLAAADFFARDPKGFAQAAAHLEQVEDELAVAEEEWLRLEMLREELEG